MTKIKKLVSVVCAVLCVFFAFSCGEKNENEGGEDEVVASYIRCNDDGTETFMVGDKPFLYFGAESRFEAYVNCDRSTYDDYEKYVKTASEIGFNVLAVSVDWADIETEKGSYDFTVINKILGFAFKYDIKIELLWYSALMCGDSHQWHLPEYVFNETPRYEAYIGGVRKDVIENSTIYGERTFLRIDDKTFMERETKVVEALMSHIYEWEKARDFPKVLIGVQVYNEVDAFPEKRLDDYNVGIDGVKQTKDQVWQTICTAMSNCAKAFKSSPYKVITRTNLLRPQYSELSSSGFSPIERAIRLYETEYLDAVGYDPYFNNLSDLKKSIEFYQEKLPKNFTHIAENGRAGTTGEGSYVNGDGELLLAVSMNCGYILYELASPKTFDKGGYSQGIVSPDALQDYSYTDKIRKMSKALKSVGTVASAVNPENFAAFNVDSSTGKENWNKTINTTSVAFNFSTNKGAKGFAIVFEGYAYVYASEEATITLSNGVFGDAEKGYYSDGQWVTEESKALSDGKLSLNGNGTYRIRIVSSDGALSSNTNLYKG